MTAQRVFAVLGRRDEPTDAVEEYCRHLGEALAAHDFQLEIRRVPWELHGWPHSLHALKLQAAGWRNTWVFVQYTALAWSARGLPLRFLQALRILAAANARIAVTFHDVEPFSGSRIVDRLRRLAQIRTMRRALDLADLAIFTVPPEQISWIPKNGGHLARLAFLPVGPNLPISADGHSSSAPANVDAVGTGGGIRSVAVFSITGGEAGTRETREIVAAIRFASEKLGKLRLSVFGRHAELREATLRDGLGNLPVDLSVEGVVEGQQVVEKLRACDVLLFVRGPVSSRRSSAIAGIACGLPVVCYSGSETASPITEAGVVLIPFDQDAVSRQTQLNQALLRLLSDSAWRAELAARSRQAYAQHFSWSSIASRLAQLLGSQ
jgi:glycosyltransferase involved in cell wall biosynthesis